MTNDHDTKYFGQNVREYRLLYNWQPFQLARKCLAGTQHFLDIENGKAPDLSLIGRVSKVFNVSIDKLLAPPKEKIKKVMSEAEKAQLESIAELYNLNKEVVLAGPRDRRIQNGVLKKPVESIDFESIDEKTRNDVAKTVCVLRELGFNVGIGAQHGVHSIEVPPLTLNISYEPKTYRQRTNPPAEEDNLINYILSAASGKEIDKILNRKHRIRLDRELSKKIKNHAENRNKLGDLSWVKLNE